MLTGDETPYFISQLKMEVWKNADRSENLSRKTIKAYNAPLSIEVTPALTAADIDFINLAKESGSVILSNVTMQNFKKLGELFPDAYVIEANLGVNAPGGFKDEAKCKEFIELVQTGAAAPAPVKDKSGAKPAADKKAKKAAQKNDDAT